MDQVRINKRVNRTLFGAHQFWIDFISSNFDWISQKANMVIYVTDSTKIITNIISLISSFNAFGHFNPWDLLSIKDKYLS